MKREALQRLRDAETLEGLISQTDSAYLLRLLGLELLLKVVHESEVGKCPRHHRYAEIFGGLPHDVQQCILSLAETRIGPSALGGNPIAVFREWGDNFVSLRYPWEKYEGLSNMERYSRVGAAWIAKGAPLDEATFRYHPKELFGILHALQAFLDEAPHSSEEGS